MLLKVSSRDTRERLVHPEAWWDDDPDLLALLTWQVVADRKSVLIFTNSKKACGCYGGGTTPIGCCVCLPALQHQHECACNRMHIGTQDCEAVATTLRRCLGGRIPVRAAPTGVEAACTRASLAGELQGMHAGQDQEAAHTSKSDALHVLAEQGIAFHHAGLSSSERLLVEKGFRAGALSVLVATSTLSAGINLPARRVILRHCWNFENKGKVLLSQIVYRQMCGRAGRAGQDDQGEAVLMQTDPVTEDQLHELMTVRVVMMRVVTMGCVSVEGGHRAVCSVDRVYVLSVASTRGGHMSSITGSGSAQHVGTGSGSSWVLGSRTGDHGQWAAFLSGGAQPLRQLHPARAHLCQP